MELTENSKNLIHYFMKTHGVKSIPNIKPKTFIILRKIYDDIRSAENYIDMMKKQKGKRFYKLKISKIMNARQVPWPNTFKLNTFPEQIIKHINENSHRLLTYTFSLLNMNINIQFIVEDLEAESHIEIYHGYVDQMLKWLYIANDYAHSDCVKDLTVFLYFTSLSKRLPTSTLDILGENHVNTAFTYSCPSDVASEIIVFRQEEWFKVFIHETFHNFGLDFSEMQRGLQNANNEILSIFKVNSKVNLFEAYTEFWAEIMNASFCAYRVLSDKHDVKEFVKDAHFLISIERYHKFFQMVKVLDFMGLKYRDLYATSKHAEGMRNTLYKEDTSVLSYYVFTCVLMNSYQDFLAWCDINNLSLLQFKNTTGNVNKFSDVIKKRYKTISMIEGVKNAEQMLNKIQKKTNKNPDNELLFLLNNTRMTLCELG